MTYVVVLVLFAAGIYLMVKWFKWQYRTQKEASARIVCPHCQVRGKVTATPTRRKRGISGGKATAAVFTLGTSMLATGLSRKERVTAMRCGNCRTRWDA